MLLKGVSWTKKLKSTRHLLFEETGSCIKLHVSEPFFQSRFTNQTETNLSSRFLCFVFWKLTVEKEQKSMPNSWFSAQHEVKKERKRKIWREQFQSDISVTLVFFFLFCFHIFREGRFLVIFSGAKHVSKFAIKKFDFKFQCLKTVQNFKHEWRGKNISFWSFQ